MLARKDEGRRSGALLLALGSGAAIMYLFDPERGARRRKIARDRIAHTSRVVSEMLQNGSQDLVQRGRGLLARLRSLLPRASIPDDVLAARVRTHLGRQTSHPHAIKVSAQSGVVALTGPILAAEADRLIRSVKRVAGVTEVADQLERHETREHVSALQGDVTPHAHHALVRREHWPPSVRLAGASMGIALGTYGAKKGGLFGTTLATLGGLLTLRASLNISTRRILGIGAGVRAVDFQKTVTVHAPRDEVFRFWSQIENFPRFMDHVLEVRRMGDRRSHWRVRGPMGIPVEWSAETTRLEPSKLFAWRSVPGSVIGNSGLVRFEDVGENVTRLDVRMSYNPPAGALGHGIASIFRADPKVALDEDLARMKSLLEEGKTSAHGETVTIEELEARSTTNSIEQPSGSG